jgi:hypothetical protein
MYMCKEEIYWGHGELSTYDFCLRDSDQWHTYASCAVKSYSGGLGFGLSVRDCEEHANRETDAQFVERLLSDVLQ